LHTHPLTPRPSSLNSIPNRQQGLHTHPQYHPSQTTSNNASNNLKQRSYPTALLAVRMLLPSTATVNVGLWPHTRQRTLPCEEHGCHHHGLDPKRTSGVWRGLCVLHRLGGNEVLWHATCNRRLTQRGLVDRAMDQITPLKRPHQKCVPFTHQ
jgi:hypothetical protein